MLAPFLANLSFPQKQFITVSFKPAVSMPVNPLNFPIRALIPGRLQALRPPLKSGANPSVESRNDSSALKYLAATNAESTPGARSEPSKLRAQISPQSFLLSSALNAIC